MFAGLSFSKSKRRPFHTATACNIPIPTEVNFHKYSHTQRQKLPFIPNESELDQLIACAGNKLQPFLQLLKETSARSGECGRLRWSDVDFERHVITFNEAEKGGNPRQIEVSDKLIAMLKRLPKCRDENGNEIPYVFGENATNRMRKLFHTCRRRLAYRTLNPRFLQIHLHTFRHWGATVLYADTKDIIATMQRLGHRSITSTQLYTQLVKGHQRDEYIFKAAITLEEAQALIEMGFEYVTDMKHGGTIYKLFRKRRPWKPC